MKYNFSIEPPLRRAWDQGSLRCFYFKTAQGEKKKWQDSVCHEQSSFVTLLDNIAAQHRRQHGTTRGTVHYIACNAHISTWMPAKCNNVIQTWPQCISCCTYLWMQQKSGTQQQRSEKEVRVFPSGSSRCRMSRGSGSLLRWGAKLLYSKVVCLSGE